VEGKKISSKPTILGVAEITQQLGNVGTLTSTFFAAPHIDKAC